jgi:hypothetical protein
MNPENNQLYLMNLEIEEIIQFFLSVTSTKAVQYLGVPMIEGQEEKKDLVKARLAIDCTKVLVEKLEPYVSDEELKQLNSVISNLQFAYIRESS